MTTITSEWISRELYQTELAVLAAQSASIYHRLPWLDAVADGFGAEILFARVVGSDVKTLALTPFMCKKKGPFRLIGTPLSGMHTEFTGPLFQDGLANESIAAVIFSLHQLVAKSCAYIEWGSKGAADWGMHLMALGYRHVPRLTTVVDLSVGQEAAWAGFKSRARNMVRKSEKAGVVSRTLHPNEEWTAEYYAMLSETFERKGRAVPHPYSFYKALVPFVENGDAHVVGAFHEGKMVSGAIFLLDGRRILLLSAASTPEAMKVAGSSSVQWHAISEAIATGFEDYDMGGLGVPLIDTFKRSFGGRDLVHHRWVYQSRLFRTMEPFARWALNRGWLRLGGR
jgi:CelD/BcsL family acetyltransferase involved in cellulose biosynthesis